MKPTCILEIHDSPIDQTSSKMEREKYYYRFKEKDLLIFVVLCRALSQYSLLE